MTHVEDAISDLRELQVLNFKRQSHIDPITADDETYYRDLKKRTDIYLTNGWWAYRDYCDHCYMNNKPPCEEK
jgi:hypothetical protein